MGISYAYLHDLERGNRQPNEKIATIIIRTYSLDDSQQRILYDAIAASTNELPYDVTKSLKSNPDELQIVTHQMKLKKRPK